MSMVLGYISALHIPSNIEPLDARGTAAIITQDKAKICFKKLIPT